MKSKLHTKKNFGITQEEMAMILGISPSLWSMYESGKRSLPTRALLILTELRGHLESESRLVVKKAKRAYDELDQGKIESLLRNNEFQQMRLAHKITMLEKKRTEVVIRATTAYFLERHTDKSDRLTKMHNFLKLPRKKEKRVDSDIDLELKKALLDFERKWLEDKAVEVYKFLRSINPEQNR